MLLNKKLSYWKNNYKIIKNLLRNYKDKFYLKYNKIIIFKIYKILKIYFKNKKIVIVNK